MLGNGQRTATALRLDKNLDVIYIADGHRMDVPSLVQSIMSLSA